MDYRRHGESIFFISMFAIDTERFDTSVLLALDHAHHLDRVLHGHYSCRRRKSYPFTPGEPVWVWERDQPDTEPGLRDAATRGAHHAAHGESKRRCRSAK